MITLGLDEARRAEMRAITYQQGLNAGLVLDTPTTGVSVSQYNVNSIAAWWDGINVIGGDIGLIDRHLMRRSAEDDRERATGSQLYRLLHDEPNRHMTAKVFWHTLMAHVLGWGNGYAEIEWDNAMRPIGLWPITPDLLEPVCTTSVATSGRKTSDLWYLYRGQYRIEAEDILHIPGLGFDGIKGYSVVLLARQSLGLAMAAERFGGAFYGHGAWPGMVLEHPKRLSQEAQERLRMAVNSMHQGADKAFQLFIAEEGMKLGRPITVNPGDAQHAETREFQIEEIARWLNLPPHKLKHRMGDRPGGNLETAQLEYLTGTLLPWTTLIEQECNRKLINKTQRGTLYVEHNFSKLLRADAETRSKVQKTYYDMNVLSKEQIARQENFTLAEESPTSLTMAQKIEMLGQLIRAGFEPESCTNVLGLPAIKHTGLTPITVTTQEDDTPPPPPAANPPAPGPDRSRVDAARRGLFLEVAGRFVRREAAAAKRAAGKGAQPFARWVEDWYAHESDVLREQIEPPVRYMLELIGSTQNVRAVAQEISDGYAARSRAELLGLSHKGLEETVVRLVERWETTRAVELVDEIAALAAEEEKADVA